MKNILLLLLILNAGFVYAQDHKPFEGKLSYRSLENTDKTIIKWSSGMSYNGARNSTFLIKGNKVLFRDECTHMCTLLDPDNNIIILYSDLIGKGMQFDYDRYTLTYLSTFSKQGPSFRGQSILEPSVYRIQPTGKFDNIKGRTAEYVQGRIENAYAGTSIDIYRIISYDIPTTMYVAQMYGIEMDGLITKFTWEQLNNGGGFIKQMKSYVCSELIDIDERKVDDSEFDIPRNIKINNSESPFKVVELYKANAKYLIKHNMYPTQLNEDVTYNIDEEWDF